ncbi:MULTISPECIES: DNA primase [unclassified Sphingobium]|uniref:DNA primase n=1 Tax=unclassified Sphingobium TaxID=2611147 RepID=UPI00222416EB|nr:MULTISPECIES: DNA primase [unclassified Sphingobium]MCW2394287.1 DNA primase [Sphingobium sp. B8D3B]MCW2417801.1 DNA primase [Sphingobium sp. B8D3C]
MSLTPQWLDELRARTTLSTLIGKTIKVQKAGREYKACCPFHNEKTPSFTINDEKGFYHCFGCGAHGDAIRWMTDQRGLPFLDAVKELAAAAGMEVPAPDPRAAKRAEQAKSLHDVTAAAQNWFEDQLGGLDGAEARAYLHKRALTDATRRAFGLGFAPDSRGKLKTALRDFPEDMLVEAGMLIRPEDSERDSYDRFRGRLMIPIRDQRGRVIAFGGRILGQGEPKYLNSPETPLFDKGRTLFNLDKAAPAARKAGRIIVVEGYMDVIAIAQAGIAEAVAPLGTALTEAQIEKLWSMVETPILCFDGDGAGQRAAIRAAHRALPLLRPGHSLAFATLPAGQDPDDLLRAEGLQAFEAVLASSIPLADLIWRSEHDAAPLATPEERAGLKQRLNALAATIADSDIRALYSRLFKERYDALFFAPRAASNARFEGRPAGRGGGTMKGGRWIAPPPPATQDAKAIRETGGDMLLLRAVLAGLLRFPGEILVHREALDSLSPPDSGLAKLLDALLKAADRQETVETEALLTILGSTELYNMAKGLLRADALHFTFTQAEADGWRAQRDLAEAIGVLVAMPRIEAELAAATRAMAENLDEASFARQQALRKLKEDLAARAAELAQPLEE